MTILITMIIVGWLASIAANPLMIAIMRITARMRLRTQVFDTQYIDGKQYYIARFRNMPCINTVDDVDMTKAFGYIKIHYAEMIVDTFQLSDFNRDKGINEFRKTFFVLSNKVIIELCFGEVLVFFSNRSFGFANEVVNAMKDFIEPAKEEPYEINIITSGYNGLYLKPLEIKPTELDIGLYYNDDFTPIDAVIRKRLMTDNDKGIILLHGLPGTGKTTYLRHLIGTLQKKVLFVSPSTADNLMSPTFMDLLIANSNAVLVIEDAENVIMDRKADSSSSVSNLLNLSDGLLSDCLNVQIICTFNNALSMVDQALMRKGRLIAKYEFGKLSAAKAQRLSDHLGLEQVINRPMTLAEITHPGENDHATDSTRVIGFRREEMMLEN